MPIYEYQCQECGTVFEKLVGGYEPEVECPWCEGEDIKKLISRFGFAIAAKDKGEWLGGPKK